ncbi:uncharacterized protein [Macrobrachium rosenbergii]|uniref:uncharacterized protein n=1 Tax=Macrobrachium rosenbergii TaxID=79674 RepID=UPI0034D55F39
MDWKFIFFICCLLLLASLSSAHSETRTTSGGTSTTFSLPEEGNVVVALSMGLALGEKSLNYRFSVHGREISERKLDYTDPHSMWKPFLFISKEVIRSHYWKDSWIPAEVRGLKGRQVEVSSSHDVKWQVLSLPLNDYDVSVTSPGQDFVLNLPEVDDVWIALWNKDEFGIPAVIQMSSAKELTVNKGWSIISLSKNIFLYDFWNNKYLYMSVGTQLTEGHLKIITNYSLSFQVIPMPLVLKASETRTTSWDNCTIFRLPEEENVVVAFLTGFTLGEKSLNYKFSVHGREISKRKLDYTEPQSHWRPFLFISKEVIRGHYWKDSCIPTEARGLEGRQVEVSSSRTVKWQVLSLPLNEYDVNVTSPGQDFILNLPEHDHVWIAFWNKNEFGIPAVIQMSSAKEITVNKGWSIISLSKNRFLYDSWNNRYLYTSVGTQLTEGHLKIITNYSLSFQVFTMPLESKRDKQTSWHNHWNM